MASAIGRVGHEQHLTVVDHLSELRARLLVSLAVLAVAFAVCLWQNHALLHLINAPLARQTQQQVRAGDGPLGATYTVQRGARIVAGELALVVSALERPGSGASPATRASLSGVNGRLDRALGALSAAPQGDKPVTLGIGEPFTATLGVSLLFALILALPVLLYELYSFLLPALSPAQQRSATPLLLAIPVLFAVGVVFGYLVVLPAAVRFFENFNSGEFNTLVQAGQYYHFAAVTLLAMGLVFQVPVAILAATRTGLVTVGQLRGNRRYALLACGLVAAFIPGDAVTLILETAPLYLLFEASVLLAALGEHRVERRSRRETTAGR